MVLVTGGTGLIGSHLLCHLTGNELPIRAIHRARSDLERVHHVFNYYYSAKEAKERYESIEWVEADITEISELQKAFNDITKVYHCAAMISYALDDLEILQKVNVLGTTNIVNLCLERRIKKLCYVSSVAALGITQDGSMITDKTPFDPLVNDNVYAITKHKAEIEVWRGIEKGLRSITINPGVVFGEGFWDKGSIAILKLAEQGVPFAFPGISGFVDVRDVARAMVQLMDSNINNEQFIIVAENPSFTSLMTRLAKRFNNKPPSKRLPKWLLMTYSTVEHFLSKIFSFKQKLPKATIKNLYSKNRYDGTKIEKALEFRYNDLSDTLSRVVKYYREENQD